MPANQTATVSRKDVINQVGDILRDVLTQATTDATAIDPLHGELVGGMQALIERGGKRNRPYLAYLAYVGYGGTQHESMLKVAASQELYHAAWLMHDDVIDQDTMRWGGPNLIGVYAEKLHATAGADAPRYAAAMSQIGGILATGIANELILNSGFSPELTIELMRRVDRMVADTGGGEALDVLLPITDDPDNVAQRLLTVAGYKTARYTFETPLHLGAIAAGAGAEELQLITDCSLAAGTAFQLTDDLLGVFGDPAQTGKSVLSDLREGKHTLLWHFAVSRATAEQKERINTMWGDTKAGESELGEIRELFEATGAKAATEELARQHASVALKTLEQTAIDPTVAEQLAGLIKASVGRKS